MASINVSAQGKLYFDFRLQDMRCREYTKLNDSPDNRRKMKPILKRLEAEIALGTFKYEVYFPNSKRLKKINEQAERREQHNVDKTKIPTFKEFTEQWYAEMSVGWRKSYQTTISTILDLRLKPTFGHQVICDISKSDVLQFRASLAKVTTGKNKTVSAQHINRHIKILKMIINEAADRHDFSSLINGIKPLKVRKTDIKPFSLQEVNQIISNVRFDYKSYYTVRFFTGMRTAEIDGLQWKYVDFARGEILIRETLVNGEEEYTKTDGSQRAIKMTDLVRDALLDQREITGEHKYVFVNRNGEPLDRRNVTQRVWYPLLRNLGLEKRNPYQTRHTAATLLLASGEAAEWIARQLGHANTEMLFRVYSRYVPNLTRNDGSAFERLLQQSIDSEPKVEVTA